MAKMILILGITATGKGTLAFELAQRTGAEIISIDSMKVYRRMDIGTAKPSVQRQNLVKYHLIDVVEPSESFGVDRFLSVGNEAINRIKGTGKPVIAVGGTAMYIKALLYGIFESPPCDPKIRHRLRAEIDTEGLVSLHDRLAKIDPQAAARIHPNDEKRIIRALEVFELTEIPISSLQQQFNAAKPMNEWTIIGLRRPKAVESHRINLRVKKMFTDGLVDEVKKLLAEPQPLSQQARCAIGYAEIIEHLAGKITLDDTVEKIKINTRRLAKAQRTWFKTFKNVNWLDIGDDEPIESILSRTIEIINGIN